MPDQSDEQSIDQSPALHRLLADVVAGRASADELMRQLAAVAVSPKAPLSMAKMDGATVDLDRRDRCGFAEVVYGQGKPAELIRRIIDSQIAAGQDSLVTRLDAAAAETLCDAFPDAVWNPIARTLRRCKLQSPTTRHVAVVTAGSTDIPVAEEAIETLRFMNVSIDRHDDIGVAGPQRLLDAVPRLRTASALIVVAGMEGALPSVVAGHLSVPIIAVPTSVGYGASLGGLTALLGMLSACASNVAVVNIDAGFKGGYLAGMIVHQIESAAKS